MSKNSGTKQKVKIDYDGRWKTLIEALFEHFIEFFLIEIYHEIDFGVSPIFLKQDTSKIVADKRKKGDLIVDNLVQVKLKDGTNKILVIHIEVQGYKNVDYGKKMYRSFCRIDDNSGEMDVTSFVLYVADRIPKNHDHYEYKFGKTEIKFKFPVYLIKNQKEQELLQSSNPFAIATLVCLKILKIRAKNKGNKKEEYLKRIEVRKEILALLKDRYDRMNYTEEIIVKLVEFVMTILAIPDEMEKAFEKEFYQPYILKHSDMELSVQGRRYANMLGKAHFGTSFEEMLAKWKKAEQERDAERKLRKEAEQRLQEETQRILREEAERKLREETQRILREEAEHKLREEAERKLREEAERKLREEAAAEKIEAQQKTLIINLRFEADFSEDKIATILAISLEKVKQILSDYQQNDSSKD